MNTFEMIWKGEFTGVYKDTRTMKEGGLYVPIVGENFDGNTFIKEAFRQGAKASLVDRDYFEKHKDELEGLPLDVVENSLTCMQDMAHEFLKRTGAKVIGITGSMGKTTTKGILHNILRRYNKNTYKNPGNHNNLVGMPQSILNAPNDTQIFVLEMGLMKNGEIERLAEIARPDIVLITNALVCHNQYFESHDEIIREKLSATKYFTKENTLIINEDDPDLGSLPFDFEVLRAPVCSSVIKQEEDGKFSFLYQGVEYNPEMRGDHLILNMILSIECAKLLGVPIKDIQEGIRTYTGDTMRFYVIEHDGITIINDAYNANRQSIMAAIRTMSKMHAKRHIAVIGDIYELGDIAVEEHKKIGEMDEIKKIDYLITLGNHSRHIAGGKIRRHYEDIQELIRELKNMVQKGDCILVKGSRGLAMERIVDALREE